MTPKAFTLKKLLGKLVKKRASPGAAKHTPQQHLAGKYVVFQSLLRENNRVLSLMADMEEKLSGEYLFDRYYLTINAQALADAVSSIIQSLDTLAPGKYEVLFDRFHAIRAEVTSLLSFRKEVPPGELTIPLQDLAAGMTDKVGGKIAQLGEIRNRLGLPVPDGFAVTAFASKLFLAHNRLGEKINGMLQGCDISNLEAINAMSGVIRAMVTEAELPLTLKNAIRSAADAMHSGREPFPVSVRSSALLEDGDFSFAGQYATYLNVAPDAIARRYKEVVASLFTPRAIFYYKTKGLSEDDIVMAVGVVRMIHAKAGGVLYTADPNDPARGIMIVNAVRGLGKAVVDGTMEPDYYAVAKGTFELIERKPTRQTTLLVCDEHGGVKHAAVPAELQGAPCLSDRQVATLAAYGQALERHYGVPQDIEWAVDQDDRLILLQSRPLRMAVANEEAATIPRRVEGHAVLLDKGVIACKGIGYGKAFLVRRDSDLESFPAGSVLVARHTSPKYVTVMTKAAAIITDIGGVTGHMASLSREYGVPTILDAERATSAILPGQEITVDAFNCNVYAGKVETLLAFASKRKNVFQNAPLFKTLQNVLKWIVPLNLVDPEDRGFRPERCGTFHDITRFAHEKAMAEMFLIGEGHDTRGGTIALGKEGPLDAHFIDMDGSVAHGVKTAGPADIRSVPFSAFLKGLLSLPWPEPRPADFRGFFGMMMQSATIPETVAYQTGRQSFALIARNYMNFSIRLGYHFSMVEAYAGEVRNDNYIKYFFKGGGAAVDRRLRRVRVITEILKLLDFRVSITEDVVNAALTKYDSGDIERRLEILGKLTVYTRQLDLIMYNDSSADKHIEEFLKIHAGLP